MGLIIPNLNGGYNKFGGGYMSDGKGNETKIGGMYYADGKGNAIKIYSSFLPVGTSLYDGIPSKGIMLMGGHYTSSSTNPLAIAGDSITLKHALNECPNGIQININDILFYYDGSISGYTMSSYYNYPTVIKIPKGSIGNTDPGGLKAAVNEEIMYFEVLESGDTNDGSMLNDGNYIAIISITAY